MCGNQPSASKYSDSRRVIQRRRGELKKYLKKVVCGGNHSVIRILISFPAFSLPHIQTLNTNPLQLPYAYYAPPPPIIAKSTRSKRFRLTLAMASLLTLSPELHGIILPHLPKLSRHSLSLTNRYFHALVGRVKLSREETWQLNLRREQSDPHRYHRTCSKCCRFLQFWHFSRSQASAKTKPEKRICLDCFVKISAPAVRLKSFVGVVSLCQYCRRLVRVGERKPLGFEDLLDHPCLGNRKLDPEAKVPYLDYFRDWFDRLEAKLPPRSLLCFRPDRCTPVERIEATLTRLEASDWCTNGQNSSV